MHIHKEDEGEFRGKSDRVGGQGRDDTDRIILGVRLPRAACFVCCHMPTLSFSLFALAGQGKENKEEIMRQQLPRKRRWNTRTATSLGTMSCT
jgi:hypothetical protein